MTFVARFQAKEWHWAFQVLFSALNIFRFQFKLLDRITIVNNRSTKEASIMFHVIRDDLWDVWYLDAKFFPRSIVREIQEPRERF